MELGSSPNERRGSIAPTWLRAVHPLGLAGALSVGVHALVGLWLSLAPAPRVVGPSRRPIEVAWIETAPPAKPVEEPRSQPSGEPAAPARLRPSPPTASEAVRGTAPPSAPLGEGQTWAASPKTSPSATSTWADAPIADQGLAPSDVPRAAGVPVPSAALPLAPGPLDPRGLHAPKVAEDLIGQLVNETIGRGKVDRGLVHPYYTELGKSLIRHWDADRAVSRKGLRGLSEQFAENSRVWNGIWMDRAAAFGRTGSPLGEQEAADPSRRRVVNEDRVAPGALNLAARNAINKQYRDQFKATRRATLRVVQDRNGALIAVELVSVSNDATVDREAVADVRAAAEKLPPPPPEAYGEKERLTSLWQFELIISISPPIPSFSFEFDEALGFIDARLPLDRRIYKRVRLIAVE